MGKENNMKYIPSDDRFPTYVARHVLCRIKTAATKSCRKGGDKSVVVVGPRSNSLSRKYLKNFSLRKINIIAYIIIAIC